MKIPLSRLSVFPFIAALWLVLVVAGTWLLCRYDSRPGSLGNPPQQDPFVVGSRSNDRPERLVMAVHPQCACTHASLDELGLIMARSKARVQATVLVVQYAGMPRSLIEGDLWRHAAAIPGVEVMRDPNGTLARRLGARTSGETYLYDGQGRLQFVGGITGARGEVGDNFGYDTLLALIRGHAPALHRSYVYGCSLYP